MACKLVFPLWSTVGAAGGCKSQLLQSPEANKAAGLQLVQCTSFFPAQSDSPVPTSDLSNKRNLLLQRRRSSEFIGSGKLCQGTRAPHNRRVSNLPQATLDSVLQSMQEAVHREGGNLKNIEDKILLRFLQSKDQDVYQAARKFIAYQKWRESFLPLGYIPESTIESELGLKQSYLQGQDKKGHPVLVTFASKHEANKGDFEEYKRFLVYTFEKTLASAPAGVDKFVTIVDLKDLGLKNLDSAAFIAALQIQQDYYPGTLEKAFMVNVPFIFYGLWKIVSPFLEEATRQRVRNLFLILSFFDCDKFKFTVFWLMVQSL
ncbi:hypothetical protein O6H91_17G005600 [Diphasiastrum complanatum]|uniref:Uncharacterized protein n=1 Tax=Diphasiastrum complanatum TaxID=34168 RepID=A0ACC2B3V0_DIPCM|nr:hypothetical protein O6H91_17G005600 [Diphasiastrum complanatum]